MAKATRTTVQPKLVESRHPIRQDRKYFLLEPDRPTVTRLLKPFLFPRTCDRPCTRVITLLPKTTVAPQTGIGYQMTNIDGFRAINAYVICDPLNSTNQRGFTLELSFSVNPFVYGVGVIGEARYSFNFENYYDPANVTHGTVHCETNDLTSTGGLPHIGGVDLTHILRAPVMGPYVRASVFNEGSTPRGVEVSAYLTT